MFDGSGEVFQWNDAVISGIFRGYRGGAWDSFTTASIRSSERDFSDPTFSSNDVGFRLVSIPEPSPWAALVGGAAVLLAWRRRRAPGR
jgi:hypothetical protein